MTSFYLSRRTKQKLWSIIKLSVLLITILSTITLVSSQTVKGPVIGIDLGTTYSGVSITTKNNDGSLQNTIIPNNQGNRITPSIVYFANNQNLIGEPAKNVMARFPKQTIYEAKRFMGHKFEDKTVQNDIKLLPFEIINKNNKPYFKITQNNSDKLYSPEQISGMILSNMKKIAESYLGEKVENAVITVPAYFNDAQRQATKDAAKIAGLNPIRIINEPTAAAIAYGIQNEKKNKNKEINVLVYDLGGGTFDVSLLTLADNVYEVLATNGDTHLGGEDIDHNTMKYLMKKFKKETGLNLNCNNINCNKARSKLKKEVEKAKITLSSANEVTIDIDSLYNGNDFHYKLTRARFEDINHSLFKKTLKPIKNVLNDAGLKKNDINEIVLIGGSTRIPKIQEMIKEYFNGKELNKGINPDEAVAIGAGIQGALLSGLTDGHILIDTIPISIGINTVGDVMAKIIEKNTPIPIEKSKIFSTNQDNQQSVLIEVYQGERPISTKNIKLGEFLLSNIPKAKRGIPQIEVKFSIDVDGILTVEAFDKSNIKNKKIIKIEKDSLLNLSKDEIEQMIKQQKDNEINDNKIIKIIQAKNKLESSVLQLKIKLEDEQDIEYLSDKDKEELMELCEDMLEWLNENKDDINMDFDDFNDKQIEFDDTIKMYMNNDNNGEMRSDDNDHEDL